MAASCSLTRMEILTSYLTQWGMLGRCVVKDEPVTRSVELESVKTQLTIRGFVAQVKAMLVYHNTCPDPLEVECVFPVDEAAAVYWFEARLNGRTIIAQCMEKKKAEKVYEEAVSAGKTAVLARENQRSADILHLALGNLPSACRAEVEVRLVMELSVRSDGGISFVLPTVLNPRYCPADLPQPEDYRMRLTRENQTVYVSKMYSMEVEGKVLGGHQIARIISHTDSINITLSDDTKAAQIAQDGRFKCDHDWSLIVYYANPYKTHVLRETEDRTGTGIMRDHLLMINLFPELPADSYSSKNEIIFVIDRSGSMDGDNIQSARSTLLLFLKSLPPGCFFNVVSFGSSFSFLFEEGSRQYSEETLKAACQLQERMDADMGGTEILQPFKAIYSKPPMPEYARQILLISDGEVWNVDQVTELVARHAHETRVFSVGIGHGASTALIRGAAKAGKGRSEMVIQQDMLQQKVMGLVASMVQDSVQGVSVSCQVDPPTRVSLMPKVPPVIFGGQHLVLYTRLPPTTMVQEVKVTGSVGGHAIAYSVKGEDVVQVHDQEMSLHRLAARAQINQWQLDGDDGVVEDLVALSLASGVVSRRTALVGVDQESGVLPLPLAHPELPQPMLGCTFGGNLRLKARCSKVAHCASVTPHSMLARQPTLFACPSPPPPPPSQQSIGFGCFGASSVTSFNSAASLMISAGQPTLFGCPPPPPPPQGPRQSGTALPEMKMDSCNSDKPSGLLGVAHLQKFDGSWGLSDAAHLCSASIDKITAANPCKSEAAWGTALVLALLERKFSEDRNQWKLMATKARAFITSCGEAVETLTTAATTFLDSL